MKNRSARVLDVASLIKPPPQEKYPVKKEAMPFSFFGRDFAIKGGKRAFAKLFLTADGWKFESNRKG